MLDPNKINIQLPEQPPASDYDALGREEEIDHETPAAERAAIIRREYARTYPCQIEQKHRLYKPGFMGYFYNMPHHAEAAWSCMKAEGITMLPLFPVFQYFLDFADPYRKIAVLVEEDATPWEQSAIDEQDELLSVAGWTVYRIPKQVAVTYETSILPESMGRCPYGEFDDDEQHQAYLDYKPQLSTETIDGFFRWLKEDPYGNKPN
jgi:very-short-patch-repair endonuclease